MIESFPIFSDNNTLTAKDFLRFSRSYGEILQRYLPVDGRVDFVLSAEQLEAQWQADPSLAELPSLFSQVKEGNAGHAVWKDCLMLAFDCKAGERSVAIVSKVDPLFLQKVSEDWLQETKKAVAREFLLLKQARIDSQTGLLNIANLFSLLETYGAEEGLHLIVVELPPKRTSFQYVLRYSHKCSTLLDNFVQTDSALHYLGLATYALVLQQEGGGERPEIESALVTYLKREGCHRVHIGSSYSKGRDGDERGRHQSRQVLDEAWTALRHAAKRGPFGFCDFSLLAHPENHPLARPDRNLVRRLGRLWTKSDTFSLVQFSSDSETCSANAVVPAKIGRGVVVPAGDDVFVFLDGAKAEEALIWTKEVLGDLENPEQDIHISAGVSSYPYCDFKKSELVFNCRKALLHAAFYGRSSAAVFDAVSLNISGDIYFGDGDLAKAVNEYKRGLKCDSRDINLHNSLGVALVMMNKLTPALQSFANGLAIDGDNFMALYNLGLGEQARNRKAEALAFLEKALHNYSHEEGGTDLVNDLTLQLGILSCELGKYEAALGYLLPWQKDNTKIQSGGRVYYYLGEAYYGLKKNRQAMAALQRALRFDEMDDRAMSLLGRLYLDEGEGDEIALSLCRKSVELEPAKPRYLLYLAEVQLRCGLYQEARENLYRCLKNRDCKIAAQYFLAQSYVFLGQQRRAKNWYAKVLAQADRRQDLYAKAEKELKRIIKTMD